MFRHGFVLIISFLLSTEVLANAPSHTLFAVDVSLSENDKNTAFDIIKETTRAAPDTHSIGLTLFDDTVRGFVAPTVLNEQQVEVLHQTMNTAPQSVRSTSNLAVGIERAIDAFTPEGAANLVVFSRGIIDTKTNDPRAQFIKWLDQVLLQQATSSNIAVILVVQQSQSIQQQINDIFAKTATHSIVKLTPDTQIAPELISLLNIPDRVYGQSQLSVEHAAVSSAFESTASVTHEDINNQVNALNAQEPSEPNALPIVRLVLLVICITLLIGILFWRYRTQSASRNSDLTAHSSSTYLPLTQKPRETMDQYVDKATELSEKTGSRHKR